MANEIPKVKVTKKKMFSITWLVPIVALGIAVGLYFQSKAELGPVVRVLFKNGEGLVEHHTPLKYHGIEIGLVEKLSISEDLGFVIAEIQLNKSGEAAAREGAEYWIVRSEIGLSRIQHLGALVSGPYIEVRPGTGARLCTFQGQEKPDTMDIIAETPGKEIILKAPWASSINKGDKIFYRDVPVGYIRNIELSKDSRDVLVKAHIDFEYSNLIRTNSKFWMTGGLDVGFGLGGFKLKTNSIDKIVDGGIAFATPNNPGPIVNDNYSFALYKKPEAEWMTWRPLIWRVSNAKKDSNLELCSIK